MIPGWLKDQASINLDHCPIDIIILHNKADSLIDMLDLTEPTQGNLFFQLGKHRFAQRFSSRERIHEARRDRKKADSETAEFLCPRASKCIDPCLGRGVGGLSGVSSCG